MRAGETLAKVWEGLTQPTALAELGVLVACVLIAWAVVHLLRRRAPEGVWFGTRGIDGVLFPLLAWALLFGARAGLVQLMPIGLLHLAVPLFASLVIIRALARVLAMAFPNSLAVRTFARTLSWVVWLGLVLWVTDLLPLTIEAMEELQWRIGGTNLTLLAIIQGVLTALAAVVAVLWLSAVLEAR
ncbi:MAG TPA: mechanosensitive ion channel protein, partial [Burkholderiaceae bacterium]|nr:mechanosensitive ion channel protein [Burkholderiaceae bacterium]